MDGVGSALTGQVRARVDADVELDVAPGLLVLAALEGDEALDRTVCLPTTSNYRDGIRTG